VERGEATRAGQPRRRPLTSTPEGNGAPACTLRDKGAGNVERIHDSSWSICCGLRLRGPLPCKRPVPKPCDDRAGCLWKGIGARYSCGAVSFAPKRNPRSGAWRKYGTGAFGHIAGSSGDTRNTGDVGIRFEIALKDEIALKEMIQIAPFVKQGESAVDWQQRDHG
jgi:hypothetical protein